ncbi:MAG: peptidylprolyl isomerase [Planctomycetota bacterium]
MPIRELLSAPVLRRSVLRRGSNRAVPNPRPEAAGCEALEPRIVLSLVGTAPVPDLADMEDPTNPVVRFVTNFGDVDIELFPQIAPISVDNFLNYVSSGRYDETLAHRFVDNFVIQAGGFGFRETDDPSGEFFEVETDPTIQNEFSRSNLERTLSFAKLGGDPDSATSQFFINLGDNSANLDNQNGGFTVFARVIDDRSWSVVQQMTGLTPTNLASIDPPTSNAFNEIPVSDTFDQSAPLESDFIYFADVEEISPGGTSQFYDQRLVYPEGFRGDGTTETSIVISNPNTAGANAQVIVRYEDGFREEVLASGLLEAHSVTTLDFEGLLSPIRVGVPYSLEIRSFVDGAAFNPQPLSAEFVHQDSFFAAFATSGEAFFAPDLVSSTALRSWGFGGLAPVIPDADPNIRIERTPFVVWQNLEAVDGSVTLTIFRNNAEPIFETVFLEANRRGGFDLRNVDGLDLSSYVGVRLTSATDIVAAMSVYENRFDISVADVTQQSQNASAYSTIGAPQTGSPRGALPDVRIPLQPADAHITFVNPSNEQQTVTLTLQRGNGQLVQRAITLPAARGAAFRLDATALGLFPGEALGAYYEASFPVFTHYVGADNLTATTFDRVGTAFTGVATNNALLANGALPGDRLIVFNPATDPGVAISVQVQFHFTDGTFSAGDVFVIQPFQRIEIRLDLLAEEQMNTAEFGVAVVTERRVNGELVDAPIIVSRYRADNAEQAYLTNATLAGPLLSLNDARILA